jgi:hypothetical protein
MLRLTRDFMETNTVASQPHSHILLYRVEHFLVPTARIAETTMLKSNYVRVLHFVVILFQLKICFLKSDVRGDPTYTM